MRTADRRTQEHPRRGTARAGALPGLVRRTASRARSAMRAASIRVPTRRRGCRPAAGPVTSGSRGPGSPVDTSPRPKMAGAGDLAGLPVRAGLSTFPQPRSSTAVYWLTSVFTQITHRPIHRTLPWQAQGWRDRSKLSRQPWSAACVQKVTGGARRARDCWPAQVAHDDHQRRPGPGTAPLTVATALQGRRVRQPGRHRFPRSPGV